MSNNQPNAIYVCSGNTGNYSLIHPISICSRPCPANEYREYHMNRCCWTCTLVYGGGVFTDA